MVGDLLVGNSNVVESRSDLHRHVVVDLVEPVDRVLLDDLFVTFSELELDGGDKVFLLDGMQRVIEPVFDRVSGAPDEAAIYHSQGRLAVMVVPELVRMQPLLQPLHRRRVMRKHSLTRSRRMIVGEPVREVWLVVLGDSHTVLTVTKVVHHRATTDRGVDGDFSKVHATETRDLGVLVGEVSPGEEGVIGELDTGNHVLSTEGNLLGFGEVVVDAV